MYREIIQSRYKTSLKAILERDKSKEVYKYNKIINIIINKV